MHLKFNEHLNCFRCFQRDGADRWVLVNDRLIFYQSDPTLDLRLGLEKRLVSSRRSLFILTAPLNTYFISRPQVFPQTAQVTDHSALPQADGRVDIEQSVKGKRSDEKIPVKVIDSIHIPSYLFLHTRVITVFIG